MKIIDILQEAYISILSNKIRSGLTILGIIVGISSVVAMISIGQGASGQIQSSIEGLGSNLLTIMPGFVQPGRGVISSGRGSAQTLKIEDVDILEKIPGIVYVSPELQRRFQIVAFGNNTNSIVVGVTPEYMNVRNINVLAGSFINENHLRNLSRVAVLGPTVVFDLFGENNSPLGKTIRINGINFKVIGILASKGSAGFLNLDDMVFVPLTTMQKILAGVDFLSIISVSVENKALMSQVEELIFSSLVKKHRVDPKNPDFSIISQADILNTLTQVTDTFTVFLAAIAGISLIVGGIGIMNMMFTNVTERTREIGLRKAVGAKNKDIVIQFLCESVVLTFLGGIFGIFFGWLISFFVSNFLGIAIKVSFQAIILAFTFSALIGIIFGYYPAKKASMLNPIDALKYE